MKLFYTPPNEAEIRLHDLGEVYLVSQSSQFTPDDLPQIETRTLHIRIEFWQQRFRDNYNLVKQVRAALKKPNGKLKIQDENMVDEDGGFIAEGDVYLEQTVVLVSSDLPENPNSWGTYQQSINLVFRYEVNDIASEDTHLQATFQKTGAGGSITLGHVTGWRENFRVQRYSPLRDHREHTSGTVAIEGIFPGDPLQTPTVRRTNLQAKMADMKSQVDGKSGTLRYGPSSSRFFDKVVRVDAFDAKIDQAVSSIHWSMQVSYTVFPNEAGYAAADFKVSVSDDRESGDVVLTLSGKVGAATEQLATAKLATLKTAALAANGFTTARLIRSELDKRNLSVDDGDAFVELDFTETYRKRSSSVLSYTLTITDNDDAKTGLIHRTYAGSVTASGATDLAAYQAAVAKVQELGDNKHPFRMTARVTRNDRKVDQGDNEFVRLDFSYDYQIKGSRIYLEVSSETVSDTFGEDSERVSGFVVAAHIAAARDAYLSQVRQPYNARLIRNETTSEHKSIIQTGAGFDTMPARLDFSFAVFKPKAAGVFTIKYGVEVEVDYTTLKSTTTVTGKFLGSATILTAAASQAAGNKLDEFLSTFRFGKLVNTRRKHDHEKVGTSTDELLALDFSNTYQGTVTTQNQILQCELNEEIVYSGTRWQFQPVPDGESVPQNCGIEHGYRTVSGTVVAATEPAAMAWVKKQHVLPFPIGTGGGGAPATRYESPPRIQRSWEFLPITDGSARGATSSASFVRVSFTFQETLLAFPYVEI